MSFSLRAAALANVSSRGSERDSDFLRAEMTAKIALSQAWDSNVERCSDESNLTRDGTSETFKGESVMSIGNHKGMVEILDSILKVAGKEKRAVVYGITPSCMKFDCEATSKGTSLSPCQESTVLSHDKDS